MTVVSCAVVLSMCCQVMYEYQGLENFWKRYNRVLLDRVALDKEKSDLLHENQQLRTLLKQYLDGLSVNDEILNQVNPLFVVNHRTNVSIRSVSKSALLVVSKGGCRLICLEMVIICNGKFDA